MSVDQTLYMSMIESLLYLTTNKLDIYFSIGIYTHFQVNPKESHIEHVKIIIRYISSINKYGISFTIDITYEICGYIDANWANNQDDRKSILSGCFYIGGYGMTKNRTPFLSTVYN